MLILPEINRNAEHPWESFGLTKERGLELNTQIHDLFHEHYDEEDFKSSQLIADISKIAETTQEAFYVMFSSAVIMSGHINISSGPNNKDKPEKKEEVDTDARRIAAALAGVAHKVDGGISINGEGLAKVMSELKDIPLHKRMMAIMTVLANADKIEVTDDKK